MVRVSNWSIDTLAVTGNVATKNTGDNTMTDRRPKIAALVADAFQEEEYHAVRMARLGKSQMGSGLLTA